MQSSYDDTVENGAWREEKKRYSKENIFDIWSTFSSFSKEKKQNSSKFGSIATFHYFLSLEKGRNEETREHDDDEEQEDEDDDDDEEEDNTFSSSRVSSVFLFLDHFRVWRTTTIPTTTTTTTTETRITER